ncbi:MAG: Uma2 family endonuclease [Cyclobacteriaceae bacterium]|nr:Uma2 family endonuclease [Cyclobacteriaceae bacterium HetDA_MAG_MS6]
MSKAYDIEHQEDIDDITLLEPEATYSYADYLRWVFEERVELIKGKLFPMSPAPRRVHQKISITIATEFSLFLKGRPCEVYYAPFDVRLPNSKSATDDQILTVVQPDICVICDPAKLDEAGCLGAPDLIVEILSPSTAEKDLKDKYLLYEEHGVKEYWVVYPDEAIIEVFTLQDGSYSEGRKCFIGDQVRSQVILDFEMSLEDIFAD